MPNWNRITLQGHVTRDPEMHYSPEGMAVVHFGLAVNRRVKKDENGERPVDFFNCTAWRQTAEVINQWVRKGNLLLVEGRMQSRKYTDPDTNVVKTVWEVAVNDIELQGKKDDNDEDASAPVDSTPAPKPATAKPAAAAKAPVAKKAAAPVAVAEDDLDESDPFAE